MDSKLMQEAFTKVESVVIKNIESGFIDQYFYSPLDRINELESYVNKFIAKEDEPTYQFKHHSGNTYETRYSGGIDDKQRLKLYKLEKEIRLLKNSYICQIKPKIDITLLELVSKFYGVNLTKDNFNLREVGNSTKLARMAHNMESIMSREVGRRVYGSLLDSIRIYNRMGIEIIIRTNIIVNNPT